jgi:hypothetical protein
MDPFDGPKLKIGRAKRHVDDYRAAFKAFKEGPSPVRVEPRIDPETGSPCLVLWRGPEPLPGELRLTAADALYNLRSALDQAVSRCAVQAGYSGRKTYFPHGQDKAGFEESLRSRCPGVPESVRNAITALEPYYGGTSYLLRALHDLNILDKHSDLIEIAPTLRSFAIGPPEIIGPLPEGVPLKRWIRRENVYESIEPSTLPADQSFKVTMMITFADVEAIKGQSVTKILRELVELTRTVDAIEMAMRAQADSQRLE